MKLIRAAGGLVWRRDGGDRVAVIHRPRQDDWTLPKGKLQEGEPWDVAALREVREETGCEVRLGSFVGVVSSEARGAHKVVLYWNMSLVEARPRSPDREVDEVAWLTPAEALRRLDRDSDRRLLEAGLRGKDAPAGPGWARPRPGSGLWAAALAGAAAAAAAILLAQATGLWRPCPG